MLNARLNWETRWADIPLKDKALLFEIVSVQVFTLPRETYLHHKAREQHPFLARFVNDWATEEIVKQYMKNKRKHHYKNGWLDVPERYAYLKDNAYKRKPTSSCKKRALAPRIQQQRRGDNARVGQGGVWGQPNDGEDGEEDPHHVEESI